MSPGSGTPTGSPAQKVFICYRREETSAHAGRLYDAMVARFGERHVFMDVDIAPGVDFVERITEVVSGCLVLIVVMGPSWATLKDDEGNVRIADPDDFVRLEVETGLRRPEVTPIPVLVSGARMPRREDLPPKLQPITRRNALELSDARWTYDVGRLNNTLDVLLGETSAVRDTVAQPLPASGPSDASTPAPPDAPLGPPVTPASGPGDARLVLEGMLVGGATALVGRRLGSEIPNWDGTAGAIAGVILKQAETWAIAGAALAVWLAIRTGRAGLFRLGVIGLLIGAIAGAVGGAIWAVPVHLADLTGTETADRIAVAGLAVTGGFLGALIGALWRPPRLSAGLASGVVAGALIQLIINGTGWDDPPDPPIALNFGIRGLAIAGFTLAALVALDLQRSRTKPAATADVTIAEP